MKIQSVKQINITILFPEPLNHALVSIPDLREKLKTGNEDQDKINIVEAPGLKVLIFPVRKREVVFEQNRLLINVKEPEDPAKSDIFEYLDKGFEQTKQDRKKIAAYGFNFDAIVTGNGKGNLLGNRVIKAIKVPIEEQGVKVTFTVKDRRFTLQLNPTGTPGELLGNINIHHASNILPDNKVLQKEIEEDLEEFHNLIQRL